MTIGQRIAQKRKDLNLSQEALGERLGVSRQAIYKWESDAALPEIDKLVTLSRLFSVTVGWLLGVEDAPEVPAPSTDAPPESAWDGELTEAQLNMVEEITNRYLSAQSAPKKRRRWPLVLTALALLFALSSLFNRLEQLDNQYNSLQNSVSNVTHSVDRQIYSITSRVEDILKAQNNLAAEYGAEILHTDPKTNTVTFSLYAVPKTYTRGMTALFQAVDGTGGDSQAAGAPNDSGQKYTAALTCALTDSIDLSVIFVNADGSRQTQLLEHFDNLYADTLPAIGVEDYGSLMRLKLGEDESAPDALTLSEVYVTTQESGQHHSPAPGPTAKIQSIRVGLFRNKTLVSWAQPCAQPDSFHGFEDQKFYRLPDQVLSVKPEDILCFSAVVTDGYGRIFMVPGMEYVSDGEGSFTYADEQIWDTDPAHW
ncbi:MAG: helix-turn-helix transcriptional regulator, partial [Oscillibacter sp.]